MPYFPASEISAGKVSAKVISNTFAPVSVGWSIGLIDRIVWIWFPTVSIRSDSTNCTLSPGSPHLKPQA